MIVDAPGVAALAGSPTSILVDARAPGRFRGDVEPLDKVAGHIPGAKNYFFQGNIGEQGTFRTPEELRDRLRASIGQIAGEDVVCYCGSGVTACHNLLALEHAGLTGARLYPGSWSEWCSDDKRPVETGG
jgi:thiosulfate/3-mercaptopyruvate sulfurtransferase